MLAASTAADRLYAGSLVVASATARAVLAEDPELVTLVASGADRGHPEDRACADYLEALLCGGRADLGALLEPLRLSDRYRAFLAARWPGFPASDLELALAPDRFGFSMPVSKDEVGLRLRSAGL
jgi:2-phosphosulfolactate phosphatase